MKRDGFTIIELLVVLGIVGILMAIAIPIYSSFQGQARVAKAQADTQSILKAVQAYEALMGAVPDAVVQVTIKQTNNVGVTDGPFLAAVPYPPAGWTPYAYSADVAAGTWALTASGDGTTIRLP